MLIWTPPAVLPEPYTVATLPPAADNYRRYAWVTDLFGGLPDYLISDGTNWKPVRPTAAQSIASATMTLQPRLNAATVILTGTIGIGVTHTISLGTSYAWPGARFRITRKAGGLGTLLTSLGLGLVANQWADHEYDGSAWIQTASGGLL